MPSLPTTIYSNCTSSLTTGCILYTTSALTTPVSNGYYSNGTYVYHVTGGAGVIATRTACPAPTSTPTSGPGCLIKGTLITMIDGSTKPIERVKIDDTILSITNTQEFFNTNQFTTIGARVINWTVHLNQISYDINNGLLVSSESHNHVIKRNNVWSIKKTPEIVIGDVFKDINNDEITITSIETVEGRPVVYNISVDNQSIYFANNILTHNKFYLCCEVSPGVCHNVNALSCAAAGYGDCPGGC